MIKEIAVEHAKSVYRVYEIKICIFKSVGIHMGRGLFQDS